MLDITCKGHKMRDNYARSGTHIHQMKHTQVNTNPDVIITKQTLAKITG